MERGARVEIQEGLIEEGIVEWKPRQVADAANVSHPPHMALRQLGRAGTQED